MITAMGGNTQSIFLKSESHKLHHEFTIAAANTVKRGQPVKLNATGEVVPAADGENSANVIGYSIHNGAAGELVTVAMKGYLIVWAMPNAATDAGPVKYEGMNDEDGNFNSFAALGLDEEALTIGWAIDQATAADEMIRVVLA